MTIFSWVLATLVDEQKTVETPSHPVSPLLKMRPYGVPPHPLRSSGAIGICWLLPLQWAKLNLGPSGDHTRRSLNGENVFQNPQMSAVFPPPCGVICYRGTTLMELDE